MQWYQVAATFGVGWATRRQAVAEYRQPRVKDPTRLAGVAMRGVDETVVLAATATGSAAFVTRLVDLTWARPLTPGCSTSCLVAAIPPSPDGSPGSPTAVAGTAGDPWAP